MAVCLMCELFRIWNKTEIPSQHAHKVRNPNTIDSCICVFFYLPIINNSMHLNNSFLFIYFYLLLEINNLCLGEKSYFCNLHVNCICIVDLKKAIHRLIVSIWPLYIGYFLFNNDMKKSCIWYFNNNKNLQTQIKSTVQSMNSFKMNVSLLF